MIHKKLTIFAILAVVSIGVFTPNLSYSQNLPDCSIAPPGKCLSGGKTCEKIEYSVPGAASTFDIDCGDGKINIVDATGNKVGEGPSLAGWIMKGLAGLIAQLLMGLSSLFLVISGKMFDLVMELTIVNMGANLSDKTGIGGSIDVAWSTLRDIANMCFIFVLLYAAFRTMFDSNFGNFNKTIKDIIIIALLINFSLFFSKVVIDASNIVSIGFYNSIVPSEAQLGSNESIAGGGKTSFGGISGGYMNMLGVQTLYSSKILEDSGLINEPFKLMVVGILSSVFMLIVAVILLITSIMFVARYIILIFLMILSPLAFIAYIIPAYRKKFEEWLGALKDQSFFAPIYFALTWVVFKLGEKLLTTIKGVGGGTGSDMAQIFTEPSSVMALVLNYVIIIGFAIAALVISKQMASKGAVGGYFKTISGGIATGAMSGTAWVGRQIPGRVGSLIAGSAGLQEAANKKDNKGWGRITGAAARATLYASQKARSGTFDARNAAIPTSVIGAAIESTIGRTTIGKKLGFNDVNIPSVRMDSLVQDMNLLGKGGTKGFKETREESEKRVGEREAKATSELALAKAKEDVRKGASVDPTTPEGKDAIDKMEKALAKLSDKQTEELVASNRELLKRLNFANAISVKQLEAINKSDKFSDEEKGILRGNRFKDIEAIGDTVGLAAIEKKKIGTIPLTPDEVVAIARVEKARKKTKDLSDSELEMINPDYFAPETPEGREFISQLKGGQIETITKNKNGKFSTTQRERVKEERLRPLKEALERGNIKEAQKLVRGADIKTMVGYMKVDGRGTPPVKIALDPAILPIYTPKTLQRMASNDDMTDNDISTLRAALLTHGNPAAKAWLTNPKTGEIEFPA